MLFGLMINLQKLLPGAQSTASNEYWKSIVESQLGRQTSVNSRRTKNKIVVMKNFDLQIIL